MQFSEIPHFIFKNYIHFVFINPTEQYKDKYIHKSNINFENSYIVGSRVNVIFVQLTDLLNFYIEDENKNLIPVSFTFKKKLLKDDNRFLITIPDSDWLHNGTKIYFKNDSHFHLWMQEVGYNRISDKYNQSFDFNKLINYNKDLLYIGQIYHKDGDEWYINHYNIWNYVVDCIPPHQQTKKLKDFVYINFDMIYNEVYHAQKNIWNLIDPVNCLDECLEYLISYFGVDFKKIEFIDDDAKRWFITRLIWLLKQKGTYSGLYNIWNIITKNSNNRLNVYERWEKTYEKELKFNHFNSYPRKSKPETDIIFISHVED